MRKIRWDNELLRVAAEQCEPVQYSAALDRALPALKVRTYRTMQELEKSEELERRMHGGSEGRA